MNKLTSVQGEKLIDLVRDEPFLYDKAHKCYQQLAMKDTTWKEISAKIGVNENVCKNAWKTLRDQFVKCQREINGGTRRYKKKYKYYEQLLFLKESLHNKKRTHKRGERTESEETTAPPVPMKFGFPNVAKEELTTDGGDLMHEFVLVNQRTSSLDSLATSSKNMILSEMNSSHCQGDLDQFFLSLAIMVRNANLTPSQTRQIQRKLLNVVADELDKFEHT